MGGTGNIVQNNIAHAAVQLDGVVNMNSNALKRWTVQDLENLFVDPFNFNLRLKDNGSNPFIGTGNSTNAPTIDNDGNIRGGDYDIGCYAYHPLDPNTNAPTIGNAPSVNSNNPSNFSRGVSMTDVNGSIVAVISLIACLVLYL